MPAPQPFIVSTREHVNHMLNPKALLDPRHAGEHLLREHRRIGYALHLAEAKVACAATRRLIVFAEVCRKRGMAAAHNGGEAADAFEQLLATLDHFGRSVSLFGTPLQQLLPPNYVGGRI